MFFIFFNRSSKISRRWSLDNLSPDSRREGYVRDLRARHRAQQLGQRDEGYPFMLSERNKQAAAVTVAATSGSGGSVSRQRHFLCISDLFFEQSIYYIYITRISYFWRLRDCIKYQITQFGMFVTVIWEFVSIC